MSHLPAAAGKMESFNAADAARERVLLRLRENTLLAANLLAEYQKAQSENKKLKASLSEAQKEIAEVKALLDLNNEVEKFKSLFKDFA
ncbi:hypothetical protein V6N13_096933 [Hibiscus sabdariffa]|uniref:Uncharacterized protein n=1 Tax=Hibiscus sabdariffa TaxID=183260 RepID=A0ABR2AS51_9ROSI